MKPTDFLKQQHREAEALFAQIEAAEGEEASELVMKLAAALASHMEIEEEVFYPGVAGDIEDDDMIEEAFEEHGVAKVELQRVLACAPDDDGFEARVKVLKELIEHHVEEEEDELFPMVEREVSAEAQEQMMKQMEVVHRNAMEAGPNAVLDRTPARKRGTPRARQGA